MDARANAGGGRMSAHTLDALYAKGYRLKKFSAVRRAATPDPVGVGLFEKRGQFFESVIFERFGTWLYTTPEKLVRANDAP